MLHEQEPKPIYEEILGKLDALLEGESDCVAALSTVACELHHAFDYYDWTGFYRVVAPGLLKVGPYQGGHGCLTIPFERGVCGRCARTAETQVVPDVRRLPYHIACSSSTLSEIVVPIFGPNGAVAAVLDVDSDNLAAFGDIDAHYLELIGKKLSRFFPDF